jgi:hypothetical protein
MPPLHRLFIVVADHPGGGARTFLRLQARRLLHLRDNHRKLWPKPSLKDPSAFPNSQQLSKRLFRGHDSEIILWASSPHFPLEMMRNHKRQAQEGLSRIISRRVGFLLNNTSEKANLSLRLPW